MQPSYAQCHVTALITLLELNYIDAGSDLLLDMLLS